MKFREQPLEDTETLLEILRGELTGVRGWRPRRREKEPLMSANKEDAYTVATKDFEEHLRRRSSHGVGVTNKYQFADVEGWISS